MTSETTGETAPEGRELILLSPYRLPTESTLYLSDEEVAAFLGGLTALWHPAALAAGSQLPHIASPYDHEDPSPHHLYAVPVEPPPMLPDDWETRARDAGALLFHATADRAETLANLRAALESQEDLPPHIRALFDLPPERLAPFFGVGFAHAQLDALCEAMAHENLLNASEMWDDVRAAVAALTAGEAEGENPHLQSAADRLLEAREVLYPVTLHLIDLLVLDDPVAHASGSDGPVADASGSGGPVAHASGSLDVPWPAAFERGLPVNVLAQGRTLQRLAEQHPDRLARLREKVEADLAEVVGGCHHEREDALLPLESQLWNLVRGQETYRGLLGREARVYARQRFAFHPLTPLLLQNVGIGHALLVTFDESVLPAHRSTTVSWPSPDGKQVEAFTRTPLPAHTPQTWFHLAHHLHETIMHDQTATLALVHRDQPAAPWYDDLLALTRFAPVLGRWSTLSDYFGEALPGDYTSPAEADEFHDNYLCERTPPIPEYSYGEEVEETAPAPPPTPHPVSWFAQHRRAHATLYTARALAGLYRGLGGEVAPDGGLPFTEHLDWLEDRLEQEPEPPQAELEQAQTRAAAELAARVVARGPENTPGLVVLNPCSFRRRVALELPGVAGALPVGGPLKACQHEGDTARVVVEVPAFGFAWLPRTPGQGASPTRLKLADDRCVRNESLEAEVDLQTGGLRAIRDVRTRVSRLGQMLVFNPGSTMRAREVRTTSAGPALGEIVSEGDLVDEHDQILATFRQRFRVWLSRPVLEMRIEISPAKPPEGYPWHAYYGARFAWRDERSSLLRGVNGLSSVTGQTRPATPDFLEVRLGRQNALILPGGLPFHQKQGGRMVDVLLVPPGETEQVFDLAIALDRDYPMQTALGVTTPVAVVPVDRGAPPSGAEGWLFHLDAPNLALTSFRPAPEGANAVVARMLECTGHDGQAELRTLRNPRLAHLIDARGEVQMDATVQDDAVLLDVASNDLITVRVEFG